MNTITIMLFAVSMSLLVALSANRYWAACHCISYKINKDSKQPKLAVVISIVIGIAVGILPGVGWNSGFTEKCDVLSVSSISYLMLCCGWILVASLMIIIFYAMIKSYMKQVSQALACVVTEFNLIILERYNYPNE